MSKTVKNPNGLMPLQAALGEFDRIAFMVQQALAKMQTATLVRIESCTNSGGLSGRDIRDEDESTFSVPAVALCAAEFPPP